MNEALQKAIVISGGQTRLAKSIGITQGQLSCWLHRDKKASVRYCYAIQAATQGAVTVHELRPDVFGPAPGIPPELPKPKEAA